MVVDIFDVISPDEPDSQESIDLDANEKESIDSLKSTLSKIERQISEKERKRGEANKKLTADIKSFIQSEVAKVQIKQEVIEKTIETRVEQKPVHIEPRIIQAPPAPPQIIKEVRVEVQVPPNETRTFAEESTVTKLKAQIEVLQKQLDENRKRYDAMLETLPMMGGSGVVGIPAPEGNPDSYVLTTDKGKAKWKVSSGGGLAAGTFSVTNNTPSFSLDATGATVDTLYQLLATLIRKLQGEI